MGSISITKLYDLLTTRVGREAAETLTTYIEEKVKDEVNTKSEILATKTDIADIKEKIASNKSDVIKWMFIFWLGQVAVTFGYILLFLKK